VGVVFDRKGRFLAVGLFDPDSPIRLRILNQGTPVPVGPAFFRERVQAALDGRRTLLDDPQTTGFRLLNGEGDRLPGLVVDRYGPTLVMKLYSPVWLPRLREVVPPLVELLEPDAIIGLSSRKLANHPMCPPVLRGGALLHGSDPGAALPFLESGLHFQAHPVEGHKTGFYLDQRANRRQVEDDVRSLAQAHRSVRVLNVFSYSGGFSLYAARGGAAQVTSVDRSEPALEQARRHFELNAQVAQATTHETLAGDAFQVMEELGRQGERFHLVVVDPPSFAKEASQVPGALAAYGKLTRLALPLIQSGGILVQASCSSRVEAAPFFDAIHQVAGPRIREIRRTGQPLDHPAGFPEGHYLKCLFARVD